MTACRLCGARLEAAVRLVIAPAPEGAQCFGDTASEARARAIELAIVQCPACGLVQSASAAVEGFRRAISAAGVSTPMRAHRLDQARRLTATVGPGARTALVGCGHGYELDILADAGLAPEGVEDGGAPAGYRGAWTIHDGYPGRDAPLPEAPYAAFACFNFLEHAPDPAGFLQGIARSIAPDGLGVVEVPNYGQMVRDRRAFDYVADHLSYFDADTLGTALGLGGFTVDDVAEARGGENLVAWVRPRKGSQRAGQRSATHVAPLADHRLAIDAARSSLLAHLRDVKGQGGQAAVWGASHQALTLLAGVDEALVTAIIDSSPAKQGRFAPASGIPVVAPDESALVGIESVVIIASGYVEEIRCRMAELGFTGTARVIRDARVVDLD